MLAEEAEAATGPEADVAAEADTLSVEPSAGEAGAEPTAEEQIVATDAAPEAAAEEAGETVTEVFYTFAWAPRRRGGDRPGGRKNFRGQGGNNAEGGKRDGAAPPSAPRRLPGRVAAAGLPGPPSHPEHADRRCPSLPPFGAGRAKSRARWSSSAPRRLRAALKDVPLA
ncbi:hypothetical protein [Mangrovicoccus ximenensis]|uniref:hypothetical protein n=1 Tax=Mangrovicoccus ximenensis TaxID=1911570 RepID=UPI000D3ACAE1|nr:hypothetical protein [Mangrovicoccus ximenensis]